MWFNPFMRWLLRSPLHFFISKNTMLMTYTGRKSGKSYATPMNYLEIENALYTISSRDRVWWRNLREGAGVTLRLRGKDVPAHGEAIEDRAEVANLLRRYLRKAPQLARYVNVRMGPDGAPDPSDLTDLAEEKVVVRTTRIETPRETFAG